MERVLSACWAVSSAHTDPSNTATSKPETTVDCDPLCNCFPYSSEQGRAVQTPAFEKRNGGQVAKSQVEQAASLKSSNAILRSQWAFWGL